jgi:hypothetical protein
MSSLRMSSDEARRHLARLELSQQGLARLIRRNPATVRRWLKPGAELPAEIGIMLELLTVERLAELQAELEAGA